MKRLGTAVLMIAVVFYATPASAIGENEEKFLQVLGSIWVIDKIKDRHERKKEKYESPEEQIRRAYEEGVKRREAEDLADAKRKAYECGYKGICE